MISWMAKRARKRLQSSCRTRSVSWSAPFPRFERPAGFFVACSCFQRWIRPRGRTPRIPLRHAHQPASPGGTDTKHCQGSLPHPACTGSGCFQVLPSCDTKPLKISWVTVPHGDEQRATGYQATATSDPDGDPPPDPTGHQSDHCPLSLNDVPLRFGKR